MIFDGHADIWTDITGKMLNNHEQDIFRKDHLHKFRRGGVRGGIFVMWTDPPYTDNPKKRMDQIVACMEKELDLSKDIIRVVKTYEDFADTGDQRIKVLIGMEGMSHIGSDIGLIQTYYDLGVRHASLTWNEENDLATGARGRDDRGLTESGVLAIKELERLGMIVDVSHLNEHSFWDAIEVIQRPFIASHSNAKAICDNPRNLSDAQIKAIAKKGGLIGMNSFRAFVSEDKALQTVEGLIQHIDHIKILVGIEHIALGFDFCDYLKSDTMDSFKEHDDENHGLDDLSNIGEVSNLIEGLRNHGYSEEEIELISYKNYDRLFKEILS
jgi:membrane dipeptidase